MTKQEIEVMCAVFDEINKLALKAYETNGPEQSFYLNRLIGYSKGASSVIDWVGGMMINPNLCETIRQCYEDAAKIVEEGDSHYKASEIRARMKEVLGE